MSLRNKIHGLCEAKSDAVPDGKREKKDKTFKCVLSFKENESLNYQKT